MDRTLRLFQVDGKRNAKLDSVFFGDMPIWSAFFVNGGNEVVCTGRRRHFYSYDLGANKAVKIRGIRGERLSADCTPPCLSPFPLSKHHP